MPVPNTYIVTQVRSVRVHAVDTEQALARANIRFEETVRPENSYAVHIEEVRVTKD